MGGNVEAYYDARWEAEQRKLRAKRDSVGADEWVEWDEYFMGIAQAVKVKSKDKHTQIGAVIVGTDNEIISTGYNSLPRGIDDYRPERYDRPEKYNWMEHAERNAIYNAARIGVSTKGARMYMTCGMSCIDCARAIIQAGIRWVYLIPGEGAKGGHYDDEQFTVSETLLKEAGINIVYMDRLTP